MNPGVANVLNLPFVQIALPILIGFLSVGVWQNKRLDEMSKRSDGPIDEMGRRLDGRIDEMGKRLDSRIDEMSRRFDTRFDEVVRRLERIETKLENHSDRLSRLEERTSLVRG